MLAGDAKHPEVEGILGCCKTPYRTFKTREELENLFKNEPELAEMPLLFCEQTTFNVEEWEKCLDFVKRYVQTLQFLIQYVRLQQIASAKHASLRVKAT